MMGSGSGIGREREAMKGNINDRATTVAKWSSVLRGKEAGEFICVYSSSLLFENRERLPQ